VDRAPETPPSQPCSDLAVPVTEVDHSQGPPDAAVILVEYGDYECPFCLNAAPIVRELRQRLGDRLRVVFRHFPQNSVHPHAGVAAQAAEAAAVQGKFWEMHDALFAHQKELGEVDLTHLALNLGLEVYRFGTDLDRQSSLRRIRSDVAGALKSGVKSTPTFFINGCRYSGKHELEPMLAAIESAAAGN
jgi:protein-disulfide isomerase